VWGSDEPHPYLVRSFTYRTEQVRTDKVKRVIVYSRKEYNKVGHLEI